MYKRGQEGVSSFGSLAAIVLILIVVVLIAMGFYVGWDKVFSIFDQTPSNVAMKVEACKLTKSSLLSSYCEIGQKPISTTRGKVYASCTYSEVYSQLGSEYQFECSKDYPNLEMKFCLDKKAAIEKSGGKFVAKDYDVNGQTCEVWINPVDQASVDFLWDYMCKLPTASRNAGKVNPTDCNSLNPSVSTTSYDPVDVLGVNGVKIANPTGKVCCAIKRATVAETKCVAAGGQVIEGENCDTSLLLESDFPASTGIVCCKKTA